jgi:hypothetical protein
MIRYSTTTTNTHHSLKKLTRRSMPLLAFSATALFLVACNDQTPPLVDTTPLGDGLKVIAYAVLGVGVLSALSKLIK